MSLASVNGIDVRYERTGKGLPIVWVGGTGVGGGVWEQQVVHFAPQYECITYDLRGTGGSSAPDIPYSVEMFVEDLVALLDHLCIRQAHFAGFSLGSAIIQKMAISHPNRVLSATLMSTWSCTHRAEHIRRWFLARKRTLENASKDVFNDFSFWMFSPTIMEDYPEIVDRVHRTFVRNSADQPIHAYIRHFEADLEHDTEEELQSIECPTLVVYGSEDRITLPRYNKRVAEKIPGSWCREIAPAGHFMWIEQPDQLNALMDDFLNHAEETKE